MDRQQTDLDPQGAVSDPSAAEPQEPFLAGAPGDEGAPPEEAGGEPEVDWRALYEQDVARERAERERLAAENQRYQQAMHQAQVQAWQAQRQQRIDEHFRQTQGLDYDAAIAANQQFVRQMDAEHQQALQAAQWQANLAVQWAQINATADSLIQRYGLTPDDRVLIGNDPQQMEQNAARLKVQRDETAAIRKEFAALKNQLRAQGALANPAYRQGGARPGGVPPTQDLDPNNLNDWTTVMQALEAGLRAPARR